MGFLDALPWLAVYYLAINLVTFVVFWWDKQSAIQGRRRTPERTLFTLMWLGGFAGALAGMLIFRHKTQHRYFYGIVAASFALHLVLWVGLPGLLRG